MAAKTKRARLYTLQQAADQLQVSVRTMHNYLDADAFPNAFKTSEAKNAPWRIPKRDIDNYIARLKKKRKTAVK